MRFMNKVLRPFTEKFMVVYFDDILVYNQDEASHMEHLTQMFQGLRQQALYAKLEKCEFFTPQVISLVMLSPGRESKLMIPRLKVSRVGLSQLLSWRSIAFMGWPLHIDGSSRILALLWLS